MIWRRLAPLAAALLWASAASAGEALWAEGEEWSAQRGSVGPDRPPFASRGACLGSNWGGDRGDYVLFRFRLRQPISDARLLLRYARRHPGEALFSVTLDGRVVEDHAAFKSTGGWGHLSGDEWAYRTFRLGNLAAGRHQLRLTSLADKNNTNLDGFFLVSGDLTPPKTRKQIERVTRLPMRVAMQARAPLIDRSLSIEDFSPMYRDTYCPVEWLSDFRALDWPRVTGTDAKTGEPAFNEAARQWDHLATLRANGKPTAVFERHLAHWGLFAFVSQGRDADHILKPVGEPRQIVARPPTYPPNFEATLLRSKADVLGQKVLRRKGDPSFEACAAFLPDVAGYAFLSTEGSPEIIAVEADGSLGTLGGSYGQKRPARVWFNPFEHLPDHAPTDAKRGLLGGCLPAIDYAFFDADSKLGWEEIAFAVPATSDPTKLEVYAYLRAVKPDGTVERHYFRIVAGRKKAVEAKGFFTRLLQFRDHWDAVFADAMDIHVPEARLIYSSRASLTRAFITYAGDAPRYGVGHYGAPQHGTFPPTTLSMVNACIEWNLLERAGRYLDYYLDHAVRPDGTFDYYGPAVSEYGQMLDVVARYARRSGDAAWLRRRRPKIESIADRLLALRRHSQAKFAKGQLRHGLVFGSPEADTRKEVNYYFSGDAWTWRGWTEIARAYIELGDEAMRRRGKELLAECDAYRADIEASIEKSIIRTTTPPFVPPVAGFHKPFATMTQDRFASYTNYRYWVEMLSAGCLRPEWHDAIIDYRRANGGELLGTTRFSGHLDDWPYAGYAYGLLLRDRVRHYLLGLYGDLATHRMRGTFTAYEQVSIRGLNERRCVADYCVPAQLVAPLMVKWMLVFEERDADVLWLCRATPRRWLAPGAGIAVSRATTRWGPVNFAITPKEDGHVRATIELPRANFPAELRLRLRMPGARTIARVTVNGKRHTDLDADGEFIRIIRPRAKTLEVAVVFGQ